MGKHGAGCAATVGKALGTGAVDSGGQGGAYRAFGPTKIAAFSVVKAIGVIVNRQGEVVRGPLDPATNTRLHPAAIIEQRFGAGDTPASPPGNTTITVVVTNQKLRTHELRQFARQVHSSMARAIQPFHTPMDGDVLYALTTNSVENPQLNEVALGVVASEVLWDAILSITAAP